MNAPSADRDRPPRRPRWGLIIACGALGIGLGLGRAYYEYGRLTGIDIGAAAATAGIFAFILVRFARKERH